MNWAIFICVGVLQFVNANINHIMEYNNMEDQKMEMLAELITSNVKTYGWKNVLFVGHLPDRLYDITKHLQLTFCVSDPDTDSIDLQNIVNYASKIVIIDCKDFEGLDGSLAEAINSPYWNPHAQLILYYHTTEKHEIATIFSIFWFHMIINAVIVQYDDSKELLFISHYNPYAGDHFKFQNMHGCWKTTKVGIPLYGYNGSFICEDGCHNITLHSKLRALHLGTCIGFDTHSIPYGDIRSLRQLNLFEDKSINLHGFVMRTFGTDSPPFLKINEESDGSYTLSGGDGMVWETISELMNFSINLDSCKHVLKKPLNLSVNVELMFSFLQRQADLLIIPVYQFDVVVVPTDLSCEYKDSGVCIVSHRAGFETVLFDVKLLQQNSTMVIQFFVCFLCIWLLFFIHNVAEGHCSWDQFGKDFVNSFRNILSISLYKPPKQRSFRIFLTISIWCFFILNFGFQAAIVSFFSAYKLGRDVDTFEDILEKGYMLEGILSPDMVLPETEERYIKINSRVKPVTDIFGCLDRLANDSKRFCLIDCSIGRYVEKNKLNQKGTQYLHIARKDRMQSYYMALLLHKDSLLTARVNKYLRRFVEMGLIQKWLQYRFNIEVNEEFSVKALNMEDMLGIFECYCILLGLSSIIFILEVTTGIFIRLKRWSATKITHWKRTRIARRKLSLERKAGSNTLKNSSTQTY